MQTPTATTRDIDMGGTIETDILIVGGGLAGLFAALTAANTANATRVVLATEGTLFDSNSFWAQGGVAAALDDEDTPALHVEDTLRAGGGLNNRAAVEVLAAEGPARIAELMSLGMRFDGDPARPAHPHLGLEGGHSRRRVLHAGGSATGGRIVEALARRVDAHPGITVLEGAAAVALLSDGEATHATGCNGALLQSRETGTFTRAPAPATILATGGASALYARTTNPPAARGTGIALAAAAGAAIADMEFVQFHPTALALPGEQSFLLSEALRGEGAYLLDARGERFMRGRHGLAELAPRDVVARAIVERMQEDGTDHVLLSLRHLDQTGLRERFPNIDAYLHARGLDLLHSPLPVAPAAHYLMGGVVADTWGATTLPGLFACGEVACGGVHGANRLASNSLLECLVFGSRAARAAVAYAAENTTTSSFALPDRVLSLDEPDAADLERLGVMLMERAGLVRDAAGLRLLVHELALWEQDADPALRPALTIAAMIARSALLRTESRGGHLRSDYPRTDHRWEAHIVLRNGATRVDRGYPEPAWLREAVALDSLQRETGAFAGGGRRDVA